MNFPSLPQGYNQLMVAILLCLMYLTYSNFESQVKSTDIKQEKLINSPDWLKFKEDSLSSSFKIPRLKHQVTLIDSIVSTPSLMKKINTDSLKNVSDSITNEIEKQLSIATIAIFKLQNLKIETDLINNERRSEKKQLVFGIVFTFIFTCFLYYFLNNFYKENKLISDRAKLELYKNRTYNYCQSCAKAFSPMLLHGKNKDKTLNEGFCVECYDNGEFLNPKLSKQDVIDEIIKANPKIKKVEEKVNSLVRWNKNPYLDNYNS